MANKYNVRELARRKGGEYILGREDLGTHACYLIYGELEPGEGGRKICPGTGHEEILVIVMGNIEISGEPFSGIIAEGEAIHLREEETCEISNGGDKKAVYVLAGGHSGKKH